MAADTISQIEERLRQLSPGQLQSVFDFVSYLAERGHGPESWQTMLASEAILRAVWERPEEDAAWSDL
jgi:hypothetical protein